MIPKLTADHASGYNVSGAEAADADDPDFATFLWLAATTGSRRGELCAALSDLDLEQGSMTIASALAEVGGKVVPKNPTNHQIRPVALDDSTVEGPLSFATLLARPTGGPLICHPRRKCRSCQAALGPGRGSMPRLPTVGQAAPTEVWSRGRWGLSSRWSRSLQ
jgi:hypothetical protein